VIDEQNDLDTISVNADTIDNLVGNRPLTLLKLNIRGSEGRALEGAIGAIKRNRPSIICYLAPAKDSLFNLPSIISNIDSDYQLYLRCDYPMFCRVYLYAVHKDGVVLG
jgi:hypothetical protein